MKEASIVLMGLSISSGIGGAILLAANLAIWASLTFMMGSALAFAGFILIVWALWARRARDEEAETPMPDTPAVQPAS